MKYLLIVMSALLISGIAWGFTHGAAMVFDSTMLISIFLILVDWCNQDDSNDTESEILKERLEKARAETQKAKIELDAALATSKRPVNLT